MATTKTQKKYLWGDYHHEDECLSCRGSVGFRDDGVCSDVCLQILDIRRQADQWDYEREEN